ncbi:MAG: hypothetical protein E7267_05640 [Lachnospiraceae bacterium]|nr:hypothetical protein [Lachnospiraceae bacterium]
MKNYIFLVLFMLITMTGCVNVNQGTKDIMDVRIITDVHGREVQIPVEVTKIVPLGNAPRMISYLGLADMVVGIEECEITESPLQAYAYPYQADWHKLPICGTSAMGETAYYSEEIMLASPDVIICTFPADVADNLFSQTGIPVVCVSAGTLFGEDYDESLRIIGEVCGADVRAEMVIEYIRNCITDIERRCSDIDISDKPSILGAGATFKGGHSIDGVYVNYPVFEIIAANDVAAGITEQTGTIGVMVDREQILAWNPDILIFDSENMGLINEDYKKNPEYFNKLSAVKNDNLYTCPNSTWHWPNVEISLANSYYLGCILYPDKFADIDFEKKANEIFEFFIGEKDFLAVLKDYGAVYGKVTLGE